MNASVLLNAGFCGRMEPMSWSCASHGVDVIIRDVSVKYCLLVRLLASFAFLGMLDIDY